MSIEYFIYKISEGVKTYLTNLSMKNKPQGMKMINSALLDDIRLIGYDPKISQDGHITVQGTSDYGADFYIVEDEEAYWVFENWGGTTYECVDGFGDIDKALAFAKRLVL